MGDIRGEPQVCDYKVTRRRSRPSSGTVPFLRREAGASFVPVSSIAEQYYCELFKKEGFKTVAPFGQNNIVMQKLV
ncbi:MAG: hypothetical protein JRN06_10125 [Nitrososphaerota archaeon]|nr:hypothetical protein [Nitrososphaerota archaeon]MDG7024944.1 hypothetical protein [Nitrososphaerota archaeon]